VHLIGKRGKAPYHALDRLFIAGRAGGVKQIFQELETLVVHRVGLSRLQIQVEITP
jgi:hypothetical protein